MYFTMRGDKVISGPYYSVVDACHADGYRAAAGDTVVSTTMGARTHIFNGRSWVQTRKASDRRIAGFLVELLHHFAEIRLERTRRGEIEL